MAHIVQIKELINGIQITETIDGNIVINELSYQGKPFIRSTNESDENTYQIIDKVGEIYNIPALATEFVLIDLNDSVYIPANGVELIESSLKLRPFRPDNERDEFHIGEIATTSNSVTINLPSDNVNWAKIGGVFYEKYYKDTFNFTPVVTYLKILILYAKPDAQVFYLAQGVESSEAEDPDYDGLLIAKITVNTSGQIVEVSNQDYKKKEESNWNYLEVQNNAAPLILELPADVRGSFYLTKAAGVGVVTVEAIKRLSIGNVAKDYMYGGRELLLFNATGGNIIIDSSAATDPDSYYFSDRITPFTLKNDSSVLVKLRGDVIELLPSGGSVDIIEKEFTSVIDLSRDNYSTPHVLTGTITFTEGTGSKFGKMAFVHLTGGSVAFSSNFIAQSGSFFYDSTKANVITFWKEYDVVKYLLESTILSGLDVTPPSAPTNIVVSALTGTSATLSWTASTDNVGVTSYRIYNSAGTQIGTSVTNSYNLTGLIGDTTYSYTIKAVDEAGNLSIASEVVILTTPNNTASFIVENFGIIPGGTTVGANTSLAAVIMPVEKNKRYSYSGLVANAGTLAGFYTFDGTNYTVYSANTQFGYKSIPVGTTPAATASTGNFIIPNVENLFLIFNVRWASADTRATFMITKGLSTILTGTGKNLFVKPITNWIASTTSLAYNTAASLALVKVKPNTAYTTSGDAVWSTAANGAQTYAFYTKNPTSGFLEIVPGSGQTLIGGAGSGKTVTSPNVAGELYFAMQSRYNTVNSETTLQIEEGSTATTYEAGIV